MPESKAPAPAPSSQPAASSSPPTAAEVTAAASRAARAFAHWMGEEPAHVVEPDLDGGDAAHVGAVFFIDEGDQGDDGDEAGEGDEPVAYVATCGLSAAPTGWSKGGAELMVCVKGGYDLEELLPLGLALASLGAMLLEQPAAVAPGVVFEVGGLPVFDDMSHLLLTSWGDEGQGAIAAAGHEPVRLLAVNALYAEEAVAIDGLDEAQALAWLDEQGVDVDDPLRDSAVDPEMAEALGVPRELGLGGVDAEQALAALTGQGSQFELAQAMQRMAGDMQALLEAQMPAFAEQLSAARQAGAEPDLAAMLAQLQGIIAQGEADEAAQVAPPAAASPTRPARKPSEGR